MSSRTRALMMGGVSLVALSVCGPAVLAGDMPARAPMVTRAPLAPVSPWTFWVEGGLQGLSGGDSSIGGLTPAFTPGKTAWGWSGAAAIDYRIDPSWHVSAAFRYGANKSRTTSQSGAGSVFINTTPTAVITPVVGTNTATRGETNWVADFMVGRDIGLGAGTSQLKAGLRVAQIRATIDGTGALHTTPTATAVVNYSYSQTSRWTGWGPRLALEGNAPLTGPWSVDYMVGVAALFGQQNVDQTAAITITPAPPPGSFCAAGCPGTGSSSSNNIVFNTDAMLGIAYAINSTNKLALNYRVDYYSNAMRVIDSAGNASNTNRIYHGPNLRWTVNF